MRFRLVVYDTNEESKYMADDRHEFFGNMAAIWFLWYTLTQQQGKKHIEVFNLLGERVEPELGYEGMRDYNV